MKAHRNIEAYWRPAFQFGRKHPYRVYGLSPARVAQWYRDVAHLRALSGHPRALENHNPWQE
jgi:hypothetical protein